MTLWLCVTNITFIVLLFLSIRLTDRAVRVMNRLSADHATLTTAVCEMHKQLESSKIVEESKRNGAARNIHLTKGNES